MSQILAFNPVDAKLDLGWLFSYSMFLWPVSESSTFWFLIGLPLGLLSKNCENFKKFQKYVLWMRIRQNTTLRRRCLIETIIVQPAAEFVLHEVAADISLSQSFAFEVDWKMRNTVIMKVWRTLRSWGSTEYKASKLQRCLPKDHLKSESGNISWIISNHVFRSIDIQTSYTCWRREVVERSLWGSDVWTVQIMQDIFPYDQHQGLGH